MNDPEYDLLTIQEVCRLLGGDKPLCTSTIYRWTRQGRLPKPVKFSRNASRWRRKDVQALIDAAQENWGTP